jgi:hypothetical protein
MEKDGRGTDLGNVIQIDDERVWDHFRCIVRGTVEEKLNAKPRPIGCATQNVTSARRHGAISDLAATSASCRPRPAK